MSDRLVIQSFKGPYEAHFGVDIWNQLNDSVSEEVHFLIDQKVAELYAERLHGVLRAPSVLRIEALESNKSLEAFPAYVEYLVANKIRRHHKLVAIGGGIIQDITCFLSATLLRGIAWHFYPTTLLAQADSCIGSKSSVNCGDAKNILGTFTPPESVYISTDVLDTLDEKDMCSGVGEMLKVHAIEGLSAFARIANVYPQLFSNKELLLSYIRRSLEVKKSYIEEDEFDRGVRNIFNYGHSFGHALESATDFRVPHGIAVSMGMDMANYVAWKLGISGEEVFCQMHPVLAENYLGYEALSVPINRFISAIGKDKKNQGRDSVSLILPDTDGVLKKLNCPNDARFRAACQEYLERVRCS